MSLKEILVGKLSKKELSLVPSSFEIIGKKEKAIAIIEIPDKLKKKEKIIADGIMKLHKSVKSVLRKVSERKGKFRVRKYKLIEGSRNTEVIHKESGCLFKLDVRKVYFSSREANERLRIADNVKNNERILVMFSGVGPFGIVIAKKKDVKVECVEINPIAHRYAVENVKLNKLENKIKLHKGDVKKVCLKLEKFDRIVMPLPKGAYEYLDLAFKCVKKNGIVHFYYWDKEPDLFSNAIKLIKKKGKNIKILKKKKVLPYGPRVWKIVVDFKVS